MNKGAIRSITTGLAILTAVAACTAADEPSGAGAERSAQVRCDPDDGGLSLPDGFCALVVHEGIGNARHLTVAANGDVYVARGPQPRGPAGNGIVALRDTTGDGRADVMAEFGPHRGTGIEIVGDHLYFSTDSSVYRYPMPTGGELVPRGEPELMVSGFRVQRTHAAKSIAFDGNGGMWVGVGAPSNNCGGATDRRPGARGHDPCPELERQAGVWRFDADRPGQDQSDGERWASGIRNMVALAYNPTDGELWAVQHGRDQLDVVSEGAFTQEDNATRPAEELLRLERGSTFSWPYCFWDNATDRRVLTPEYRRGDDEVGRCADFPAPVATFGGHWAPNDLLFYTGDQFPARYRNGAFIAFHGSWNRAPLAQEGYQVVFQPLSGSTSGGEAEAFADGFAGADEIAGVGDARHRPVGLAQGPDGSLYVSDSVAGTIWRIVHTGG